MIKGSSPALDKPRRGTLTPSPQPSHQRTPSQGQQQIQHHQQQQQQPQLLDRYALPVGVGYKQLAAVVAKQVSYYEKGRKETREGGNGGEGKGEEGRKRRVVFFLVFIS